MVHSYAGVWTASSVCSAMRNEPSAGYSHLHAATDLPPQTTTPPPPPWPARPVRLRLPAAAGALLAGAPTPQAKAHRHVVATCAATCAAARVQRACRRTARRTMI